VQLLNGNSEENWYKTLNFYLRSMDQAAQLSHCNKIVVGNASMPGKLVSEGESSDVIYFGGG
jgi:hypothetical protein